MNGYLAGYRLNWRRDLVDARDKAFRKTARMEARLPDVFMPDWPFEIRDQGQLGSCVAQGGVEAYAAAKYAEKQIVEPWHSALFAYTALRMDDGTFPEDAGGSIRDSLKTFNRVGIPKESLWPYDIRMAAVRPPGPVWRVAQRSQMLEYRRVEPDALLAAIYNGGSMRAVMFGHVVHEGFDATPASGIVRMPRRLLDRPLGGHCQVLTGFDIKRGLFRGVNSWGDGWGAKGLCYFPWRYLEKYARDFWVVKRVEMDETTRGRGA